MGPALDPEAVVDRPGPGEAGKSPGGSESCLCISQLATGTRSLGVEGQTDVAWKVHQGNVLTHLRGYYCL